MATEVKIKGTEGKFLPTEAKIKGTEGKFLPTEAKIKGTEVGMKAMKVHIERAVVEIRPTAFKRKMAALGLTSINHEVEPVTLKIKGNRLARIIHEDS